MLNSFKAPNKCKVYKLTVYLFQGLKDEENEDKFELVKLSKFYYPPQSNSRLIVRHKNLSVHCWRGSASLLIADVFISSLPLQHNPESCLDIPPKHCGTALVPAVDFSFSDLVASPSLRSIWAGVPLQVNSELHQFLTVKIYSLKANVSLTEESDLSAKKGLLLGSTASFISDLVQPTSHHFLPLRHPHSLSDDDRLKRQDASIFLVILKI